tara:strand:+ start:109 stop:558 length:450 start_codon:yes stop_codon:yes gene_type:complete
MARIPSSTRPHRAPANKFSGGKYALAISDRSGMSFPYSEMRFEWTGMFVHTSEWEPKQPQLDLTYFTDAQSLKNARPQANISATQAARTGGGLPGSRTGGVPNQVTALPGFQNTSGQSVYVGVATIPTSWYTTNTNLLQISLGSVTVVT